MWIANFLMLGSRRRLPGVACSGNLEHEVIPHKSIDTPSRAAMVDIGDDPGTALSVAPQDQHDDAGGPDG